MKYVCESCQTRYSVPDDRLLDGILKVCCKSCGHVITMRGQPWPYGRGYEFDVFIIYASADSRFVHDQLLPALSIPVTRVLLFDQLTLGELLVSEIERGVSRSRFTVVVLSPAYLADRWAVFGEQLASHLNAQSGGVIPLMIVECELPLRLDARVALDVTKRPWSSEVRRLHDRVRSDEVPTATPARGGDSQAPGSCQLELIDVSFDDYHDACEDGCEVLDFKLLNRSTASIVVKRVDVTVLAIWSVAVQHGHRVLLAMRSPLLSSATYNYDIAISGRPTPFVEGVGVSHCLRPDEADRFQIVLRSSSSSSSRVIFAMIAKVMYGADGREECSRELLGAFPGRGEHPGSVSTERSYEGLLEEIRRRNATMSKRLGRMLENLQRRDT